MLKLLSLGVAATIIYSAQCTLVSDSNTQVVSKTVPGGGSAFVIPQNSYREWSWTTISGSEWIWDGNNTETEIVTFTRTFVLYSQVTQISLIASADNSFCTEFNNKDANCTYSDFKSTINCSITSLAIQGLNNLSIIVLNLI